MKIKLVDWCTVNHVKIKLVDWCTVNHVKIKFVDWCTVNHVKIKLVDWCTVNHVKIKLVDWCTVNHVKIKLFDWCTVNQRFGGINLLKTTSYVMHQQFNIQQLYALPTQYLCVLYLSENKQRLSDLCPLQHKLIGFYNRDEKCLQRGTDWVFKYSSLRFVFKGLITV